MTVMTTGIAHQSDASLIEDLTSFYTGGNISWYGGALVTESDPASITVRMWDPDQEEGVFKDYIITAQQIRDAFDTVREQGYLCCEHPIAEDQFGYACANDFDVIVQQACYGEVVFG